MTFFNRILASFGANPYRKSAGPFGLIVKCIQYAAVCLELAALLWLPLYPRRFNGMAKPRLFVIGAQKAGTTWLDRELRTQGLVALPDAKETHHFDRGRVWTIHRYLSGFDAMRGPLVEVAPDYGPLALWRIRALARLCPELAVVFIAKNPAERAWSGLRMETGFDRGARSSAFDQLLHLRSARTRRYQDYAGQIARWQAVLGSDRTKIIPFERLHTDPERVLREVLELAGVKEPLKRVNAGPAFKGERERIGANLAEIINQDVAQDIARFETCCPHLAQTAQDWRRHPLRPSPIGERHLFLVCGFNPNSLATSSGQKLAYQNLLHLARDYATVHVLAFRNRLDRLDPPQPDWPKNVTVEVLEIGPKDRILGALAYPHLPTFASARRWRARQQVAKHMNSPEFTDFFADFSQGLGAIPPACWPLFTFRQHDVVSNLYRRRMKNGVRFSLLFGLEAWRTARWEERAWRGVCNVETLSQTDCDLVSGKTSVPVSVQLVRGTFASTPRPKPVKGRLVFWGNMARAENEDAAIHLITKLFPTIKRHCPAAHILVVGAHPGKRLLRYAADDVTLTGFVEDPVPLLGSAEVALAPLRLGSGVKIKVFETIDIGVPTVVSPVGGEGIPDHPCLVRAEDDQAFIAAVVRILGQSVPTGYNASLLARSGISGAQDVPVEMLV